MLNNKRKCVIHEITSIISIDKELQLFFMSDSVNDIMIGTLLKVIYD